MAIVIYLTFEKHRAEGKEGISNANCKQSDVYGIRSSFIRTDDEKGKCWEWSHKQQYVYQNANEWKYADEQQL